MWATTQFKRFNNEIEQNVFLIHGNKLTGNTGCRWSYYLLLIIIKGHYCLNHIVTQFMEKEKEKKIFIQRKYIWFYNVYPVLFGVIHSNTLLENLLSVIVTHSNELLMSPATPAWVWNLHERNWPYQCCATQICLQLDEQNNNFLHRIVTTCHCQ